ncbi:MAG: TerB family tellurite resistance protein [Alphaproteobacteria bacterium]
MQLKKTSSFRQLSHAITGVIKSPRKVSVGLWYKIYGWSDESPSTPLPDAQMERITPKDATFKEISFTFSLIALAAQVARADGTLTAEKYIAFREAFPLLGGVCMKIRSLFAIACENTVHFSHYVNQIKYVYPRNMPLYSELVERLFRIAGADGVVSPASEMMLAKIAHMLGLSASQYTSIRDKNIGAPDAHQVLGVNKRASATKIKKQYHELMREYHPDRYATQELSPEVEMLLRLKASEINKAYKVLSKKAA